MNKLLLLYIDAATLPSNATEAGDSKTANRCAERLATLHRQIRENGEEGANALRLLMDHNHLGVRHWAAYHSLPFAPVEAEAKLSEIANVKGSLVGFSAQMTLEQWRKGNLTIDP